MRLPLADAASILAKLCSAHALSWSDLSAAYGDGPKSAEGGSATSYLSRHGVTSKLNAAVNELVEARPADPMVWLAEKLAKA